MQGPEGEDIIKLFDQCVANASIHVSIILTRSTVSHVFGQPVAPKSTCTADEDASDFDIIKLQRAAKRARLAEATTSTAPSSLTPPINDQPVHHAGTSASATA